MNRHRITAGLVAGLALVTLTACNDTGTELDTSSAPAVAAADDLDTFRAAFELALYGDYFAACDAFWNLPDDDVLDAVEDGYGRDLTRNERAVVLDVFYTEC
jgi:hypothetical protein